MITIDDYASALVRHGTRLVPGFAGTYWACYESWALMRIPTFCLMPPSHDEVTRVLWQSRFAAASYLIPTDSSHSENACLYLCRDKSYKLENLNVAGRRDARRANRNLQICFIDWPTVLAAGFPAYRDTRGRIGLSDTTPQHFYRRMMRFSSNPSHVAVGAWKEDALAAFMTLTIVDNWVEIEGCFSDNDNRTSCPADGLVNFVLRRFLTEGTATIVSYGLSSIQEGQHGNGLHAHKMKVGFEAIPVHRAFVLHPLLRPLANRLTLHGARLVERLFPRNRPIRKASGMLACLLDSQADSKGQKTPV